MKEIPLMEDFYKRALELDKQDQLKSFRNEFFIDDNNLIYLDGNSLGRLPKKSRTLISKVVDKQWGSRLINSWDESWMGLPTRLASMIAKLIGAREDEVFVGDSTSLNLYKLLYSALSLNPDKTKIISDTLNFPTDLYVIQGLIEQQFKSHKLQLLESENGIEVSESMISKALDKHTSLVTLSHVLFKSSFMYDMKRVNEIVHENKSLIVWDLSHSVGAVPINLNETNADMAVGCTYKYLNGGPGAPAFLYVKKELQEKMRNPISAWFSHANPFDFSLDYQPVNSIGMFATGTPSVLSLAAIEPGLDISLAAGMNNIRNKSIKQSEFMIEMIQKLLIPLDFSIASPLKSEYRGSHLSIQHEEAYRISQAMIDPRDDSKSIIPDFRPPNNIRLGIAPLYNSFLEIYETIFRIRDIVVDQQYLDYDLKRKQVT